MSTETAVADRAYGAMIGLAAGDATGAAAMYHRMIRLPGQRSMLWRQATEMDAQHVLRIPTPYTIGRPEPLRLSGTDDAEYAAIVAKILIEVAPNWSLDRITSAWRQHLVDTEDEVWGGVAEASAQVNFRKGLLPPATGNDNPHHFDDSAVARVVPIGLLHHPDPATAATLAAEVASITNAADGIWAAAGMAAAIAHLVSGSTPDTAISAARAEIPDGTWSARCIALAFDELHQAGSAFAAVPGWHDRVGNASYSYGNIAPETFAIALALFSNEHSSLQAAIGISALLPKQSDGLGGMVGALVGASVGASTLPPTWLQSLDTLRGHAIPATAGISINSLTNELLNIVSTA